MLFQRHVGIDYSGRGLPTSRTAAIQAYATTAAGRPRRVRSPESRARRNWSRTSLAEWLSQQLDGSEPIIVGVDHGFSFPDSYFQRYHLKSWDHFLEDFVRYWGTHKDHLTVDEARFGRGKARSGTTREFRLTERWTSSAKSVFHFDVQGSVAKSSHAGIPWVKFLRDQLRPQVHFWPYDGWTVSPGRSVIAEVYPSLFRRRYAADGRTSDEQDAYCVCRWLHDADKLGTLTEYFQPRLTTTQGRIASREGWILGVW